MTTTAPYELLYFPIRGRAEQIRLLLQYAGVAYQDHPVTDWPSLKSSMPLGQLPVLIDRSAGGEWKIPQSAAIMRHLARKHGLSGTTAEEQVLADVIAETVSDRRGKFNPVAYAHMYKTAPEVVAQYWIDGLALTKDFLLRLCSMNKSGSAFFVGAKPTYADFMVFDLIEAHEAMKPGCLSQDARIQSFLEAVRTLPALTAYLAKRAPSELKA